MLSSLETGISLDIVIALQSTQNPFFDILSQGLYYFGINLLLLIILPVIYWSLDQPTGAKLLVALAFSSLVNALLKEIFSTPRPFEVSDEVIPLLENTGYGFPSGHVMVTVVVWGYVAVIARRWWVTALVSVYVLLMMWSRMYMGAHYPQDVVGGVILGLITLWAFVRGATRTSVHWWYRLDTRTKLALVTLLVIVSAVFTLDTTAGEVITGVVGGIGLGVILMDRLQFSFKVPPTFKRKIIVAVFGLVVTLGLFALLDAGIESIADMTSTVGVILNILQYGMLAFLIVTAYPLLAARVGLVEAQAPRFS